jgi:pyruvate kinase
VIAKMEKPQAVENLSEIIDAFDAFMVARGDLGVELPLEEVPLVQKRIVTAARRWAKPVIVATQMLESMISSPRPTRAEASDVANAILDGADAVMLSGETSVGEYPVLAVETMARIVENTEAHGMDQMHGIDWDPHTTSGVITKAAEEVAQRIGAKFLVTFHDLWRLSTSPHAASLDHPGSGVHAVRGNACRTDLELGRRDVHCSHGWSHRRDDPRGR